MFGAPVLKTGASPQLIVPPSHATITASLRAATTPRLASAAAIAIDSARARWTRPPPCETAVPSKREALLHRSPERAPQRPLRDPCLSREATVLSPPQFRETANRGRAGARSAPIPARGQSRPPAKA